MSCNGTSFVQRHLCFRVTTSLLTVLPQLAHLALLQASIRMGFFYLHESYCSTSILTRCHRALLMPRENCFCSFAFLLAWQPSCSFSPSSPLPFNYWPSVDVMPQDFSGLFPLPEKERVQSSVLCCDLPVSGAEHAGGEHLWGQGPAPHYIQGTMSGFTATQICSLAAPST